MAKVRVGREGKYILLPEEEWDRLIDKKIHGAGDVIRAVTKAARIDKVVKAVSRAVGKDCGCDKRQDALNKAMPI